LKATTKSKWIPALLVAVLSLGENHAAAGLNLNSGFEELMRVKQLESLDARTRKYYAGTTDSPFAGWAFGGKWEQGDYSVAVSGEAHLGKRSARIDCVKRGRGGLAASPVRVRKGQVLQVSLWLKARDAGGGRIFMNFEGTPGDGWASKDLQIGTYDWTKFTKRVVVPGSEGPSENTIAVFLYTTCDGTIWVDDFSLEVMDAKAAAKVPIEPRTAFKSPKPIPEPKGSAGYRVRVVPALEKIYREDDYGAQTGAVVTLSAARNEYESAQIVVEAPWRAVSIKEVRISDLKGPGGAVIPAGDLSWDRVGYVHTTVEPPYFAERGLDWYPDPLMPPGPFVVDKLSRTPIWLTLKTPKDCPAGEYHGTISIKPDGLAQTAVPIRLTVWDFALSDTTHLRTLTWLGTGTLRAFYGNDWSPEGEKRQAEAVRNYENFLLEHRLGPGGECAAHVSKGRDGRYDFRAVDAKLERLIARGMNSFLMGVAPNLRREKQKEYGPEFLRRFTEMLKVYGDHLRERGWLDLAYVYVYDEAPRSAWPEVKKIDRLIKQTAPGLKIFQCLNEPAGVRELTGYADVFDVYVAQYHKAGVAASQKKGAEVWLATCCYPMDHPNFFIEYPLLDPRVTPWICWKYQVSGFEYWSPVAWGANASKKGDKWPQVPWVCNTFGRYNGDGQLVYPGSDLRPYSSLRLEALRDGLEDYEYLWTLGDLVGRAERAHYQGTALEQGQKLLSLEGLVKENGSYAMEPERYLQYRHDVALAILQLKSVLADR